MVYFSASSLGFYPKEWKTDGTYTKESWPADAVLLSGWMADIFWKQNPPQGKILGADGNVPAWVDPPPKEEMTTAEVENARRRAYADPITGSDRMFSEASRMQIMGEDGYDVARAQAISRFEEIQAQYPWPAK